MLPQHLHIYSLPPQTRTPLHATELQSSRFHLSFEQAVAQLKTLPNLFVELDGSFVWRGQSNDRPWQIDGMLYDRNGRVQRVELKGNLPRQTWEQILSIFGWPTQQLIAHRVDEQHFVELSEFLTNLE